jgi:hypothetical protein
MREHYQNELRNTSQNILKQTEYDRTSAENYLARIEALEKINRTQNEQLETLTKAYQQEKSNNRNKNIR